MMDRMPLSFRGDFHGRTLISRGVAGFTLREMVHEPGTRIPRHSHERAHVAFVLRGAFTERCERNPALTLPSLPARREMGEGLLFGGRSYPGPALRSDPGFSCLAPVGALE
jgi:hypothetical protein